MTFEALACWWCLYLKSVETLTTRRKLFFYSGKASSIPAVTELVMCATCDNEHPTSIQDQIRLIQFDMPQLQDWLNTNETYRGET